MFNIRITDNFHTKQSINECKKKNKNKKILFIMKLMYKSFFGTKYRSRKQDLIPMQFNYVWNYYSEMIKYYT